MSTVTIYHNPKCSKSRETLTLLRTKGIEPTIIEYLKHPPTASELKHILKQLGIPPRDLLRKNELEYKAAGLDNQTLSDQAIIAAMVAHPKLIERPIVVTETQAALGRPPEDVLKIL